MRLMMAVGLACLFAATASAQTVAVSVELGGYNAISAHQVEDDGDPETPKAWLLEVVPELINPQPGRHYRLIVPKATGLCEENVFTILFGWVDLDIVDGRHVLLVFKPGFFGSLPKMDIVTLDRVKCRKRR